MRVGPDPGVRLTVGARWRGTTSWMRPIRSAFADEIEEVQPLTWLALALILGAGAWFTLHNTPPLPVTLLVLCLVLLVSRWSGLNWMLAVMVPVGGFVAGMIAADLETRRVGTVVLDSPVTAQIGGRVVGRDRDHRGRWRYTIDRLDTSDPEIRRAPTRIRLVAAVRHAPVAIGQVISGRARLRPPSGPALPGGYDFSFHAYFQRLGAHGYFLGRPGAGPSAGKAGDWRPWQAFGVRLAGLRETIATRIRTVLPGEAGSLAVALTVADRRGVDPGAIETLRVSGLAHVLAISGLHMALVAGTFFWFVRGAFCLFPGIVQHRPVKKYAALGALAVATAYLVISGASVSTRRAFIMLAIMLIAVLVDRRALTLRNVAIAAIVIVVLTPSAVTGPGFQMSFAATAMLVAGYGLWQRHGSNGAADRPVRRMLGSVALFFLGLCLTSLVAGLATAPFALFHFNRIATLGLVANLLAMPVVTFLVMPAGLLSMLAMPFGWERGPLIVMGKGLEMVMAIARHVESLGGALVSGQIGSGLFAVMVAGIVVFVFCRSRLRLLGLAMLIGALPAVWLLPASGRPDLLISEDGRMVGIVNDGAIATNQRRPPEFIFRQWRHGLGDAGHQPPVATPLAAGTLTPHQTIRAILADLQPGEATFRCLEKQFCLAGLPGGQSIISVEDLAFLGAACDQADLVVTARPITMARCYSGAMLVTGRMLRQTGSLQLVLEEDGPRVRSAISDTNRPWTRHRIYDWRSRGFMPLSIDWMEDDQ